MVVHDRDPIHQLIIRTHQLTVVIATPLSNTVGSVKQDVLSALRQFSDEESFTGVPKVATVNDFEICRYNMTAKKYVILATSGASAATTVKDAGLKAWEKMFLRFRDSTGNLTDVQVRLPPLLEDEGDESQ